MNNRWTAFWFLICVALTMTMLAVDSEIIALQVIGFVLSGLLFLIAVAGVNRR